MGRTMDVGTDEANQKKVETIRKNQKSKRRRKSINLTSSPLSTTAKLTQYKSSSSAVEALEFISTASPLPRMKHPLCSL